MKIICSECRGTGSVYCDECKFDKGSCDHNCPPCPACGGTGGEEVESLCQHLDFISYHCYVSAKSGYIRCGYSYQKAHNCPYFTPN